MYVTLHMKYQHLFIFSTTLPSSVVIIAINEAGQVVAFACGETNKNNRNRHVSKANLGVIKSYRGTSVARQIVHESIEYLKANQVSRIEATIIKNNVICLNLCKK